jgi:predicted nuclease of predicted toxin-antitoxin system
MKLLVDMNLTPRWTPFLAEAGWESIHWSSIGDVKAKDSHTASWARSEGYWSLTNDLDFPQILAHIRAQN